MTRKTYPEAIAHLPTTEQAVIKRIFNRVDSGKNALIAVVGATGCLSGDTKIKISRHKNTTTRTIREWYKKQHIDYVNKNGKIWDRTVPMSIRSFDGAEIRLHKINDIVYSGNKKVYELRLKNGFTIKATADHQIKTRDDWVELQNLKTGDLIMCDTPNPAASNRKRIKLRDIGLCVGKNHPYNTRKNGEIEVHRLIYEAELNNLEFTEYLDILLNEPEICKTLKYINPQEWIIHHKDGNHYNNSIDNLEKIKPSEHHLKHNLYSNFSQGAPKFSEVESIKLVGIEDTYDICCEEPHHNFVANNIVVHNSGKSYAVLSIQRGLYLYQHGVEPPLEYMKSHCLFKAKDFLEQMMRKDLRPMETWLYDESGVDLNSKNHASAYNKVMNFLVQTFRHLQQIVFFTLPSFSFLDKSIRKMIHYRLETTKLKKSKKINKCKFFRLQYSEDKDKIYKHCLKIKMGKYSPKLRGINTALVPKPFAEQYEEQKEQFNEDYKKKLHNTLQVVENKEEQQFTRHGRLTERQEIIWECIQEGITDREVIKEKAGFKLAKQVSENLKFMRNKGYNVPRLGKSLEKKDNAIDTSTFATL